MRPTVKKSWIEISKPRVVASVLTLLTIPVITGCWVQSVYPFYEESDVAVDPALVGIWEGQAELKSCLLNVTLNAATRTYTLEVTKSDDSNAAAPCANATFEGKLVQINEQRFLDVVPDQEKCWAAPLEVLVKIEMDKQKVSFTPLDPDWMESAMEDKSMKLQGRTQEFGAMPQLVAVTLVSPTNDLRQFLRQHGNEKTAFSETGRMVFQRK